MSNAAAPRCPNCGIVLTIPDVALLDPQTSPWLCNNCRRGFWEAELTRDARDAYNPIHHGFGMSAKDTEIRTNTIKELTQAFKRGTSIDDRHLRHLTKDQVALLLGNIRLHSDFAEQVKTHALTRGMT